MTKSHRILLIVLSFVVTLMIGYALFSESVNVSGTATSKGTFDISASCVKGVDTGLMNAMGITQDDIPEGGYHDDYCTVSGNNVAFGADLEFPGARRYFTVLLTNNGTIPATLNLSSGIRDDIVLCLPNEQCQSFRETLTPEQYKYIDDDFAYYELVSFVNTDGDYVIDEDELQNFLDADGENIILEPNESMVVMTASLWNEEDESKDQEYVVNHIINFDFTQYVEQ